MKKIVFVILAGCVFLHGASAKEVLRTKDFLLEAETNKEKLILTLSAKTTGWVAIAIEPEEGMEKGDIQLGWVDDALGIAMGNDCFGTSPDQFESDMVLGGEQNMLILSGAQDKNHTKICFSFDLDSGDKYDKALVRGKAYKFRLYGADSDSLKAKPTLKAEGEITIP